MKFFTITLFILMLSAVCVYGQEVLFSEDFTGGIPATWTNVGVSSANPDSAGNSLWVWTPNGALPGGLFWGAAGTIQSPTASTGAVGFNSDKLDNNGVAGGFGSGSSPAPHRGELISPVYDLSDAPSVSLKFHQSFRNFSASTLIGLSNDGGATWEEIEVNAGTAGNASVQSVVILDVSDYIGGSSQARFKFIFDGDYYYWIVDDVELIEPPANNLAVGVAYYPPASRVMPTISLSGLAWDFSAFVSNLGGSPQENTTLKVSVLDSNQTELWTSDVVIDVLPVDYTDSLLVIPGTYDPSGLTQGNYTIRYEVFSPGIEDFDPSDNVKNYPVNITTNLFAKENGSTGGLRPGAGGDYFVGNYYRISENLENLKVTTNQYIFRSSMNAADGTLGGKELFAFLYRVTEEVEDDEDWTGFNTSTDLDNTSLEIVGFKDFVLPSAQANNTDITVVLEGWEFGPNEIPGVQLIPGERYIVGTEYLGDANVAFQVFNNTIPYFQISTIIRSTQWFLGGFGENNAAYARLNLLIEEDDDVSASDVIFEASVVNIFPVPANDMLTIDINFEQPSGAAMLITDMNGKLLKMSEFENVTSDRRTMDVSDLPVGNYIFYLSNKVGYKAIPFSVVR